MSLVDEFRTLILATEAKHHAEGWDQPHVLYRVSRSVEGEWVVHPCHLHLFDEDPYVALETLAFGMENKAGSAATAAEIFGRPIAHFVITEAWARVHPTGDPEESKVRDQFPDKAFADIPGSVEMRYCHGVLGRHVIGFARIRGREPVPTDNSVGRVAEVLRRLHRASMVEA